MIIMSFFEQNSNDLNQKCFRCVTLLTHIAEDPGKNAHLIDDVIGVANDIKLKLEEKGFEGDGNPVPETTQLDVVDLIALKTASGLKDYFAKRLMENNDEEDIL